MGWTSIYQLFWCSLGTRVLTHPHIYIFVCSFNLLPHWFNNMTVYGRNKWNFHPLCKWKYYRSASWAYLMNFPVRYLILFKTMLNLDMRLQRLGMRRKRFGSLSLCKDKLPRKLSWRRWKRPKCVTPLWMIDLQRLDNRAHSICKVTIHCPEAEISIVIVYNTLPYSIHPSFANRVCIWLNCFLGILTQRADRFSGWKPLKGEDRKVEEW